MTEDVPRREPESCLNLKRDTEPKQVQPKNEPDERQNFGEISRSQILELLCEIRDVTDESRVVSRYGVNCGRDDLSGEFFDVVQLPHRFFS